jgi:hypothetical protein
MDLTSEKAAGEFELPAAVAEKPQVVDLMAAGSQRGCSQEAGKRGPRARAAGRTPWRSARHNRPRTTTDADDY